MAPKAPKNFWGRNLHRHQNGEGKCLEIGGGNGNHAIFTLAGVIFRLKKCNADMDSEMKKVEQILFYFSLDNNLSSKNKDKKIKILKQEPYS